MHEEAKASAKAKVKVLKDKLGAGDIELVAGDIVLEDEEEGAKKEDL